jgi:hypothetical protein
MMFGLPLFPRSRVGTHTELPTRTYLQQTLLPQNNFVRWNIFSAQQIQHSRA